MQLKIGDILVSKTDPEEYAEVIAAIDRDKLNVGINILHGHYGKYNGLYYNACDILEDFEVSDDPKYTQYRMAGRTFTVQPGTVPPDWDYFTQIIGNTFTVTRRASCGGGGGLYVTGPGTEQYPDGELHMIEQVVLGVPYTNDEEYVKPNNMW